MIIFIAFCSLFVFSNAQSEDSVKNYSKEDFLPEIAKRNNFIMFFAPWCSHCKKLHPVWEELASDFNDDKNLAIAKVDCTIHTELCSNQDITGYPTLKLYKVGEVEGTKFKGSRDIPTLKKFIRDELGESYEASKTSNDKEEDVLIELSDDSYMDHVTQGNHFVKFFAPWCSHCQSLAPTWHKLAESLKQNNQITVAKVDCTIHQKVCSSLNVMSYPSLLWIRDGKKVDTYQGPRTLESLQSYVTEMLHPSSTKETEEVKETPVVEKAVISLNDETFHQQIDSGITFVKFFAPWCGHCKRLAPTWDDLAKRLSDEGKIKIAHVDCTLEENKELCNDQEVEGYPTLFLYRNGVKISEYNGSRSLEDLIEFVNRHTSSHDEL